MRHALWPAKEATVVHWLALGRTVDEACDHAGISVEAYHRRRRKNPDFKEQIEIARLRAKMSMSSVLFDAAINGDWRAAALWLETHYRNEWGRRNSREIDVVAPASAPLDAKINERLWNAMARREDDDAA